GCVPARGAAGGRAGAHRARDPVLALYLERIPVRADPHRAEYADPNGGHGPVRARTGHGVAPHERYRGAGVGAGADRHDLRPEIRHSGAQGLSMAEVVLTNVRKSYGAVVAVADLSLSIADREFVVFVGPSGCGKSTAASIWASPTRRLRRPNARLS